MRSYGKKMLTSRRKAGRIRGKRSATTPTTSVRRTESSENSPFTVTLKYFEGDSTRFEERLLYAKNQAEADRNARKYLSGMWGSDTEINTEEDQYTSPDGGTIIQYRGASPSTKAEKAYLKEKGDVWKV